MSLDEAKAAVELMLARLRRQGFSVHGWDDGALIITDLNTNAEVSVEGTLPGLRIEGQ